MPVMGYGAAKKLVRTQLKRRLIASGIIIGTNPNGSRMSGSNASRSEPLGPPLARGDVANSLIARTKHKRGAIFPQTALSCH